MQIDEITAVSFGHLKNQTLTFAPGMTVIFGPNEAGKSTWHSAIYAALCGNINSLGINGSENASEQFIDLYHPWDGNEWVVQAVITLNDKRRVVIWRDLTGKTTPLIEDTKLNNDISTEITSKGTADASLWLGLDRQSFLATAFVRQADIFSICERPESLAEYIRCAAASASADISATEAIARITEYKKVKIGKEDTTAASPLSVAIDNVKQAALNLEDAKDRQLTYIKLDIEARRLSQALELANKNLKTAEALAAKDEADHLLEQLNEARELHAKYPDGPPGIINIYDNSNSLNQVRYAIASWEKSSVPASPSAYNTTSAPSAASKITELQTRLDSLPPVAQGDTEPSRTVVDALDTYKKNKPEPEAATEASVVENRAKIEVEATISASIATIISITTAGIKRQYKRIVGKLPQQLRSTLIGITGTVTVAGLVLTGMGNLMVGLIIVGIAGIITVLLIPDSINSETIQTQSNAVDTNVNIQNTTTNTASTTGSSRENYNDAENTAYKDLHDALLSRGIMVGEDIEVSAETYIEQCQIRKQWATLTRELAFQLATQRQLEETALSENKKRTEAVQLLFKVAREILPNSFGDDMLKSITYEQQKQLVDQLRNWQKQQEALLKEYEKAVHEYTRLTQLLEHGDIGDLENRYSAARQLADILIQKIDPIELAKFKTKNVPTRAEIDTLKRKAADLELNVTKQKMEVQTQVTNLLNVAEAEERLEGAKKSLEHLRNLEHTLNLTIKFLEAARDKVHNSLAPLLSAHIEQWITDITGGRWIKVKVDPLAFDMEISNQQGNWRNLAQLSQGTREQIYLLLRTALVEQLTKAEEQCPLLLDDITAQCDAVRTQAILDLLHKLSKNHQIILFSQDHIVSAWAESRLKGSRDIIINLDTTLASV
ncbi:MAG: AAA family ATPase [Actinobacteria bacterium]|nr:AAA family ATPase [Actinomycetota bacterium]MCL6104375.1 AAA family ATPase [Actinomycetota bacterium]